MAQIWNQSLAKRMRIAGKSWKDIGRRFGVSASTAQRRYYPEKAKRDNEKRKAHHAIHRKPSYDARALAAGMIQDRQAQVDWLRLRELIPPDTRDLTGRILGDPLPGRSALDMERAG